MAPSLNSPIPHIGRLKLMKQSDIYSADGKSLTPCSCQTGDHYHPLVAEMPRLWQSRASVPMKFPSADMSYPPYMAGPNR
ncbi:MAG: hypothetical protein B6245_14650 [Desulfobacteraceae bacterium 4572_88]|nr:MAG: hypothetical protein B6245_14650 [Desulfobacteraceae bacterium 4572_88]RLC14038.1 MAG: hypothetical protein DRI57_15160 [Deltaproteobacteria bacterium]